MNQEYNTVQASFGRLKAYCEKEDFKGWDPYDGLNSKLFRALPIVSRKRWPRLAWIQLFKRSPVNLRPLTGVAKDYNPKGLGLFLSGYCNLYYADARPEYISTIKYLADKLLELRSPGWSGSCWGYNFDWQARAFFQPRYTPTVVATTFIAYSLMDAYEITGEQRYLDAAVSAQHFVLKDLNRTYDEEGNFAFSYSPEDQTQVFNASLLGSRLLSRIYHYTGDKALLEEARKSIRFCCRHQKADGSWSYGTLPFHQWVDNFHTGYNLECITEYRKYSGDHTFDSYVAKGLRYYLDTFFTKEGIAKYYNNKMYPVDIHNTAQLVITLSRLGVLEEQRSMIDTCLLWSIVHMQDRKGYFYYQIKNGYRSRIPYVRWAQGWMFYGMSEYLKHLPAAV